MSRILRFLAVLVACLFSFNAFADYTCPTLKTYTSCKAGYYLSDEAGADSTNSCQECPGISTSVDGNTGDITSCYVDITLNKNGGSGNICGINSSGSPYCASGTGTPKYRCYVNKTCTLPSAQSTAGTATTDEGLTQTNYVFMGGWGTSSSVVCSSLTNCTTGNLALYKGPTILNLTASVVSAMSTAPTYYAYKTQLKKLTFSNNGQSVSNTPTASVYEATGMGIYANTTGSKNSMLTGAITAPKASSSSVVFMGYYKSSNSSVAGGQIFDASGNWLGGYVGTAATLYARWSTLSSCGAGKYRNSNGVCTTCESGYYCTNGYNRVACKDPVATVANGGTGQAAEVCGTAAGGVDCGKYIDSTGTLKDAKYNVFTWTSANTSTGATTEEDCIVDWMYYENEQGDKAKFKNYYSISSGKYDRNPHLWRYFSCAPGYTYTMTATSRTDTLTTSATSCTKCPAGKYCPGGSYTESDGETAPVQASSCPSGYTSDEGATSAAQCYVDCEPGKVVSTRGGTCTSYSTTTAQTYYVPAHRVYNGNTSGIYYCPSHETTAFHVAGGTSTSTATSMNKCISPNVGGGRIVKAESPVSTLSLSFSTAMRVTEIEFYNLAGTKYSKSVVSNLDSSLTDGETKGSADARTRLVIPFTSPITLGYIKLYMLPLTTSTSTSYTLAVAGDGVVSRSYTYTAGGTPSGGMPIEYIFPIDVYTRAVCDAGTYKASHTIYANATDSACSNVNDGCFGGSGATSACPNNCNALTPAVSVTGGTYSSDIPRSANTSCRYVAPAVTKNGCSTVTQNKVSYSGTAWDSNYYTAIPATGYHDCSADGANPACCPNEYTITLDKNNAGSRSPGTGTSTLYTTYNTGVYNDSARSKSMTTSANGITAPEKVFTVTYNANSGTVSPTSANASSTFGGYYSAESSNNGSGTQYVGTTYITSNGLTAGKGITANATWYAKWSTPGSVTLPTPTRNGYTFNGWYTAASGGTKVGDAGATYTPTASVTLYAQWTANTITLKWANGGHGTAPTTPASCLYDGTFTMPAAMTATGYTFSKWSVNSKTFDAGASVTCNYTNLGKYSGEVTITGTWTNNVRTVTLDDATNGGSGGSGKVYQKYATGWSLTNFGTTITKVTVPTKTNSVFTGYYTAASGGTRVIAADGTLPANTYYTSTGSTTLNAQFASCSCTKGSNVSSCSVTGVSGNKCTYSYTCANGYQTSGTFTGSAATGANTSPSCTPTTYTITYNLNGGTNYSGAPTSYNVTTATITLGTPTRANSTFGGWYTESSFTNKVTQIAQGSTGNKTFYAKWTCNSGYYADGNSCKLKGTNTTTVSKSEMTLTYPTTTGTFTASCASGTPTVASSATGVASVSFNNGTATVTWESAGTANITVTCPGTTTLNSSSTTVKVTTVKGTITATFAGNSKTYNGSALTCNGGISGLTPSDAKVEYSTDNSTWSTTAPTRTAAGTTTVYYRLSKTNYNNKTGTFSCKVNNATITVSASDKTLTYTGSAQSCGTVSVTTPSSGATVKYGTTSGTYNSTSAPTITNAGTKTIYYQVTATNYTTKTGSFTCTVNKANGTTTIKDGNTAVTSGSTAYPGTKSLTVTCSGGATQSLPSSSSTSIATVAASGSTLTLTPKATGTATITANCPETSNYKASSATYAWTVSNGTITATVSNKSQTYNGSALTCNGVSNVVPSGATVTYAVQSNSTCGTYGSTIPTRTDAGTTTVCYKISMANYTDKTGTFTCTVNKAANPIAIDKTTLEIAYPNSGTITASKNQGAVTATSGNTAIATVSVSGTTVTVNSVKPGNTTVTVKAAGNGNYNAKEVTASITVVKGTNPIALSASSGSTKYSTNKTVTVSDAAGTLSVKSGNTAIATASVSGTTVTMTPVKPSTTPVTITVTAAGNDYYNAGSKPYTLTVNKADNPMTINPTSGSMPYSTTKSLFTVTDYKGNVTAASGTTSVATVSVSGTTVNITSGASYGTSTITVSDSGNDYYASGSKTFDLIVNQGTITLNNNGATSAGTAKIYATYNTNVYLTTWGSNAMTTSANGITVPTRTGYTFGGYYDSTNYTTQYIDANGKITSNGLTAGKALKANATWYAKWTGNCNKITINPNCSSQNAITVYKKTGTTGWFSDVNCSTSITKVTLPTYCNTQWDIRGVYSTQIDVSADGNPGTQYFTKSGNTTTAGTNWNPTADSTIYMSWVRKCAAGTGATCSVTVSDAGVVDYTTACKTGYNTLVNNNAYNPSCSANNWSVVYNKNATNATGTMSNSAHVYDVAKNLTTNAFTNGTQKFNGWNTKADGSGTSYANGASVKNLTTTNNGTVTLYAQWTSCTACAAGTGATCTLSAPNGVCTYTTACKTGYNTLVNSGKYNPSCSANTYTVAYNINCPSGATCSSAPASTSCEYDKTCTFSSISSTSIYAGGYKLTGWASSATGTAGTSGSNLTSTNNGTVTRYAIWTKCDAGTYHPAATGTAANVCTSASKGYYVDAAGATGQTACPKGTYGSTTGLKTSACSGKCSAGRYGSATGQTAATCNGACTAGYYCPAGSTTATAYDCDTGTTTASSNNYWTSDAGAGARTSCYRTVVLNKNGMSGTLALPSSSGCKAFDASTNKVTVYYNTACKLPTTALSATATGTTYTGTTTWATSANAASGFVSSVSVTSESATVTYYAGKKYTCSAGYYLKASTNGACAACLAGNWCEGVSNVYYSDSAQGLKSCSGNLGTGYTSAGGTDDTANTKCYLPVSAGYVRSGTSGTTTTACGAGMYKAAHNAYYGTTYTCSKVNAGYWNNGGGTNATGSVISGKSGGTIAAGRYGAAGATSDQGSGAVAKGYYSTGGGTSSTPTAAGNGCVSGKSCGKVTAGCYADATGSTSSCPKTCPGLYVNSVAGSDDKTDCYFTTTDGYYIVDETDTALTKCGNTFYCPATTLYYPNVTGDNRKSCPDASSSTYMEQIGEVAWLASRCPDATTSNSSITQSYNQTWGAETASVITECRATMAVSTPCANFSVQSAKYNSTTERYDSDKGEIFTGNVKAGYYLTTRYSDSYCNPPSDGSENTKPMYYKTAAKCPANSYCPGGSVPKCNTGTYNTSWGANTCASLNAFYTTSAAGATAATACYGKTTSGKFVETKNSGETACTCGGYCPGDVTVYYGSTGGKTDCTAGTYNNATSSSAASACKTTSAGYYAPAASCTQTKVSANCYGAAGSTVACPNACTAPYSKSASGSDDANDCYLTTTAGKYVKSAGAGETACISPYFCPGGSTIYKGGTVSGRSTTGGNTNCNTLGAIYAASDAGASVNTKCYATTTAGNYVKTAKDASETTCPAGSKCVGGAKVYYNGNGGSEKCAAGYYQPNTGKTTCEAAAAGYYVSGTGATEQTACTGATYQDETGKSSCKTCPTSTGQTDITSYSYWNGGKTGDHTKRDYCIAHFGAKTLADGEITSSSCRIDKTADTYGLVESSVYCEVRRSSLKCNGGYYNRTFNNYSSAQYDTVYKTQAEMYDGVCRPVEAGYWSADESLTRTACTPGHYQDETGQTSCKDAAAGYYVSGTAATTQTACTGTTYQDETAQRSCKSCPTPTDETADGSIGYYIAGDIHTTVKGCYAGFRKTVTAGTIEGNCFATDTSGDYANMCNNFTGSVCSAGYYYKGHANFDSRNEMFQGVCQQVPAGKYFAGGTVTWNTAQVPGTCATNASSAAGSDDISDCSCNAGYAGNAATSGGTCTACAKGTYKASAGNTTCTNAGIGYYVDATAATSRKACTSYRANTSTTGETSTASSDCVCVAGRYLNGSTCAVCAAGSYKSGKGNGECTAASKNYFVDGTGKTAQSACTTLGSFYTTTASTGSTSDKCYGTTTAGKYIKTANSSTQETCTAGSYCPATEVFYGGADTTGGRKSCPSGYDDGGTGLSQQSQCAISCSAGTRVATPNAACTTPAGNWYVGAHNVTYGKTSSVNSCPTGSITVTEDMLEQGTFATSAGLLDTTSSYDTRVRLKEAWPVSAGTYTISIADSNFAGGIGHIIAADGTYRKGGNPFTVSDGEKFRFVITKADNTQAITPAEAVAAGVTITKQYGISGTSASNHDAKADCQIVAPAGTYVGAADAMFQACAAGTYKDAASTLSSGSTNSCTTCSTANTYSNMAATACTSCNTGYTNSGSTPAAHAGPESCSITCAGGQYVATAGAGCVTVGTGYWGAGGTVNQTQKLARTQCPPDYRTGAAASAQNQCSTSCGAGTMVETANAACTTPNNSTYGASWYTGAHTVTYGKTSKDLGLVNSCPTTNYTTPNTTTSGDHNAKADCTITCSAGTVVANADANCSTPSGSWYSDEHTVAAGSKSSTSQKLSCLTNYATPSTTTKTDHDTESDCTITCSAGTQIATQNATSCTTPSGNWYVGSNTVKQGETSSVNSCAVATNLFNPSEPNVLWSFFNPGDSTITATTANNASIYVPVEPNTTYIISGVRSAATSFRVGSVATTPANGVAVSNAVEITEDRGTQYKTTSNAKYIVLLVLQSADSPTAANRDAKLAANVAHLQIFKANEGYGIIGNTASDHDAASDCQITCSAGEYLPDANGVCQPVGNGNFRASQTLAYGATNGRNACSAQAGVPSNVSGTYTSVAPRGSIVNCRFTGNAVTKTGCSSVVANTVAHDGTAWGTNYYTAKASAGYRVSSTDGANPSCTACVAGYYQASDNFTGTSCTAASAGYFVSESAASSQTACTVGSYTDTTGQSACIACGDGENNEDWGMTTSGVGQTSCNATCDNATGARGWESAVWNADNTVSNLCILNACNGDSAEGANGYYKDGNSCVLCSSFANGLYPHSSKGGVTGGKEKCFVRRNELPGQYIKKAFDEVATDCPKEQFWPGGDDETAVHYGETYTCKTCDTGTYADEEGLTQCKACPTGYEMSYGKKDDIKSCRITCGEGYYIANVGDTECSNVGPGYWAPKPTEPTPYGSTGTRNQCPSGTTTIGYGAGADEAGDCGRVMNVGGEKLYLRSDRKTKPSFNVTIGSTTYYGNMSTADKKISDGATKSLKANVRGTIYSVYDDSGENFVDDNGTGLTLDPNAAAASAAPASFGTGTGPNWSATMSDGTTLSGIGMCDSTVTSGAMGDIASADFTPNGVDGPSCWCKLTSPSNTTQWVLASANAKNDCVNNCGYFCGSGMTGTKTKNITFRTNLYQLSGISIN